MAVLHDMYILGFVLLDHFTLDDQSVVLDPSPSQVPIVGAKPYSEAPTVLTRTLRFQPVTAFTYFQRPFNVRADIVAFSFTYKYGGPIIDSRRWAVITYGNTEACITTTN